MVIHDCKIRLCEVILPGRTVYFPLSRRHIRLRFCVSYYEATIGCKLNGWFDALLDLYKHTRLSVCMYVCVCVY
jgi:hypothetical protein